MCFVEWFKEWGGYLFAIGGMIGGVFMYLRHDRTIKQKETLLKELQIKQLKK